VTGSVEPARERPAPFRCAAASESRAESVAGTASTVRAFVALEDPGPWGVRAPADSRLPAEVKAHLSAVEQQRGVKVLLVRRALRRSGATSGRRLLVAHAVGGWLETVRLDRVEDVTDLDLAGLGAGRSPGLERMSDPAYLVCTHGRHDACCAERGRPFAAALAALAPEQTWEVSHIGGDRFAANALVLPHGLYYGRLPSDAAARFAQEHANGRLDLEHLRGRSRYAFAVQYAEIELRRHLGDPRIEPFPLRSASREGPVTSVVFEVDGASWRVEVESTTCASEQLTCRAAAASPSPAHRVLTVAPA
jgi:hypothetical protein